MRAKNFISPYAVIEGEVKVGRGVRIGRYCYIKGCKNNKTLIGDGVVLSDFVTILDGVIIGADSKVGQGAILGYLSKKSLGKFSKIKKFLIRDSSVKIGKRSLIRPYSVIYKHVTIGERFSTGIGAIIREHTSIGSHCIFGTYATCDGYTIIGNFCHIGQYAQLSQSVRIGNRVFIGGHTVFSDNKFMIPSSDYAYQGAVVKDRVRIGLNVTILPDVVLSEGSVIGAGSVVTKSTEVNSVYCGNPAKKLRKLTKQEIALYRENR